LPEGGPKVLWTFPLGEGYGGAAVRDGEVYLLDCKDGKQDILRCIDLERGDELWSAAYDAPGNVSHDGSRTVPTVDDKHVFTVGVMGDFKCFDRRTHEVVWSKNLVADFNLQEPMWGVVQLPLLRRDLVIVAPQAPDAFVAAYRQDTGALVWKSSGTGLNFGYSTPRVIRLCGEDQVVMSSACNKDRKTGAVTGLSVADGSLLWAYDGWQCGAPIPYPTPLPGDRLFLTGGYKGGSVLLQFRRENGVYTTNEVFSIDLSGSLISQPLFYKDFLYINSTNNQREDGLICLGLDGAIKWKTHDIASAPSFGRGPLLLAEGLLYDLDSDKGILCLIEPTPDGYRELSRVHILDGKEIFAPMALSQGKLLIRNQKEMKCLDVSAP
jgi:outer membrane protein assembly factor BamB